MCSKPEDVLILGYGNPLRGDDGAGPHAARCLRQLGFHSLDVHQLTPELAEAISRTTLVLFLDAGAGLAPGQVRVTPVRESPAGAVEHQGSPGGLLRLAREIYGCAPTAFLIAMGGEAYDCGCTLSSSALSAVDEALDVCLHRFLSGMTVP